MNKAKLKRTLHDMALGFFVNAGYSITQGGNIGANSYILLATIALLYLTNKGD